MSHSTSGEEFWAESHSGKFESLGAHEVRVWWTRLDRPDIDIRQFESWLSVDEKQRAEQFRFDRDRHRFVARRAVLRALLGDCIGVPAHAIAFAYGAHGKPELSPNPRRLHFNTSHSQDLAVIVMAVNRAVGIDVEWVKPLADYEAIARKHFSEAENAALSNVPSIERLQAFFNCWTRKEAFVKARGDGLTLPLDSFEVSVAPGDGRLVYSPEFVVSEQWSLRDFAPAAGFVGAVVAAGRDWSLNCP